MCPVAGADIVVGTNIKFPGRRKESVNSPNICPLCAPSENERLIIRVGQSATTTDSSRSIRRERVVGDRDRRRHGKSRASYKVQLLFADPDKTIHIHHHRVLACGENFATRTLGLIAGVEQKLIDVRDSRLRRDPGVGCAHSQGVYTPDLGYNRQRHHADHSEKTKGHGARAERTSLHEARRAPSVADCSRGGTFGELPGCWLAGLENLARYFAKGMSISNPTIATT